MNKRILASIKKDVKIILKSWRSHGASILFMVAILIFVMFTTESNYPELNEEVFSLGKPRVENVLLIIPFVFSFIILQPINQELFYRERVGKNFETAFATPLKKEELWLSKVLLSTTIGFIYYSISIAIVILSVKLFFPNMWFVLTSLGVLPIANSAFLTILAMLQTSSIVGWLFLIVKNCQNVNKAPLVINFAFMWGYGLISRKIPFIPMLTMDMAMITLTIVVMMWIRKVLAGTKLERIILND